MLTGTCVERKLRVNDPDIGTLEAALLERMFYCKQPNGFEPALTPLPGYVQRWLREFRDALLANCGRSTPKTTEEVVEAYRGRKRTVYQNALRSLQQRGLNRGHALSKVFVKAEKGNPLKAPRCINPRCPEYNLVLGTFIKHIEHRIYRSINKLFGGPTVMKGYDVVQVGEIINTAWNEFVDPVALGLDAEKFDMHVHDDALAWEHSVYLAIFNGHPLLRELLMWQRNNRGVGYCDDGKLRFKVKGKRFSGDMNTALGNVLIMCGMVWAYARLRDVKIRLINNGDDCVIIMESRDLDCFTKGLKEWFADLGFRMTSEVPVYSLEAIEFCQMHPIRTQRGWTMVRNIATAREKDSICLKALANEAALRKWMLAIGECGLALCAGVPIMQSMYQMYIRNGLRSRMRFDPALDTGLSRMRGKLESEALPILPETRLAVFVAWDITPDEQLAIETMYDSMVVQYDTRVDDLEYMATSTL